jgi:hypothetical protein
MKISPDKKKLTIWFSKLLEIKRYPLFVVVIPVVSLVGGSDDNRIGTACA